MIVIAIERITSAGDYYEFIMHINKIYKRIAHDGKNYLSSELETLELSSEESLVLDTISETPDIKLHRLEDSLFDTTMSLIRRSILIKEPFPHQEILQLLNVHSYQKEIESITISVIDKTDNGVGLHIEKSLIAAGFKPSENPSLIIQVCAGLGDIEYLQTPSLVVICNRIKISIGPILWPFDKPYVDESFESKCYQNRVDYKLTESLDGFQREWLSNNILRFLLKKYSRFVDSIVEFNLAEFSQEIRRIK